MGIEAKNFSYDAESRVASVEYSDLIIRSSYLGQKNWNSGKAKSAMPDNWNNHIITIENTKAPMNDKTFVSIEFEFWESINAKVIKTEESLLGALGCFLSDARSARDFTFTDFCSEFGYEEIDEETGKPNKEAKNVYNACKTNLSKLNTLGISAKLDEITEDLNERGL